MNVDNEIEDTLTRLKEASCLDLIDQYSKDLERLKDINGTLKAFDVLFDITFKNYSSIIDFEKAKKEYLDINFWEEK
jgi:hypothetical protein